LFARTRGENFQSGLRHPR